MAIAVLASIMLALFVAPRSGNNAGTRITYLGADIDPPVTTITINGDGSGPAYDGVGAVLGGGGNARYLMDYPAAQRRQILDYLFKPGYGASLQILKLEIGGDGNSSDGSEPSIEHTAGHINCNAGYEFAIARQAVALNPALRLYGLQWGAPGWVSRSWSIFTGADITYLLDWLGCARRNGLAISYLGGWNERDNGTHAGWFHALRLALDAHGYRNVQLIAGDANATGRWMYPFDRDIAILGAHVNCGFPTGALGALTWCGSSAAARQSRKPLWGSELGGMDAGSGVGCAGPCAPALDRAFTREFIDAQVTGILEWPAIDSMPAYGLPFEHRGLLTADQPWSGSYQVNAMTWAIAQITQFVQPPSATGKWMYLRSASGYLQGNRAYGSYVTLVRSSKDQWSTIIETTAGGPEDQRVRFTIKGRNELAHKVVHVWSTDFNRTSSGPARWFVRQRSITPFDGKFSLLVKPGYVYSLTTTTGQGRGTAASPPPVGLSLPFVNKLSSGSDEPPMLVAQDGAFELAPCHAPGGLRTCTEQTAVRQPVLWVPDAGRRPYAIIGSNWANYAVSVDVMLPRTGSVGLIGRFSSMLVQQGAFNGYVFEVAADGRFELAVNRGGTIGGSGKRPLVAGIRAPFVPGKWHRLSLSVSGSIIRGSLDGVQIACLANVPFTRGMPGIEVGGWYPAYFSQLNVTPVPAVTQAGQGCLRPLARHR